MLLSRVEISFLIHLSLRVLIAFSNVCACIVHTHPG